MTWRADAVAAARECVGTPFVHQGRINGRALDCAGVVVHVAARLGADYLDVAGYSRQPHGGTLESVLDSQPCLQRVAINDIEPGDVLVMRFGRVPQHLGIWTGDTLIHAYETVGACVEHRMDDKWRARIVRAYRITERQQ